MRIQKDIEELLEAGVITEDTAERIQAYYEQEHPASSNRLLAVFGVLGAILLGLGIILIVAHNWDNLSRPTKTILAFLPLIIGQILCGFTLIRKSESMPWREATASFLFFAVGACLALISQIYNVDGELRDFVFTWMLLCLPLVYVMRSSMVALLYLVGISQYVLASHWDVPRGNAYWYWGMLVLVLPHYYGLWKQQARSNFTFFHHWFIALSVLGALSTFSHENGQFLYIAYMSLLGLFYLIGQSSDFEGQPIRNNGYLVIGSLGTVVLLLGLSFNWFWRELHLHPFIEGTLLETPEFWVTLLVTILAVLLLYRRLQQRSLDDLLPIAPVFLIFIIAYGIGTYSIGAAILANLLVLGIGVFTVRKGALQNHLGVLNYGLLIITALVICRFFDTNLSFVLRGLLFIMVGLGFFFANYWLLKQREG